MKSLLNVSIAVAMSLSVMDIHAQEPTPDHLFTDHIGLNSAEHPCISPEEYARMEAEIQANRLLLGLDLPTQRPSVSTVLEWPLRTSASLQDCGYYYISAFVDQNTATGSVQDWNCGTRTYDGHRGVDIVPWPFIWDKMDHDQVEVIASAPGTIIGKLDGNPDRVCNGVGGGSTSNNYITIQHVDGSTALYIHMKTGSLTSKTIGQTVSAGEYLGIVGSAGQSTGVHLHFEIRSDGTFPNFIDPFYGSCNTGIGSSWWASQKPYVEPQLLKVSMHSQWPYMASCPNTTDTLYESYTYPSAPGTVATFYACTKHVLTGDSWSFRILDSGSSVVDSWNYTSTSNRNTSTLGWNRTLPVPPGTYTLEGTFLGQTCSKTFEITAATGLSQPVQPEPVLLFPNPSRGQLNIHIPGSRLLHGSCHLMLYNAQGVLVASQELSNPNTELELGLPAGLYLYTIIPGDGSVQSGTHIIAE